MTLVTLLGILIGAIMGLTGAGGGILAVPVLVAGMHWSMQQAAPVALIAVAVGAGVGAIDGFRYRLVRYKAAIVMAISGIPVTRLGQYWAHQLPQYLLLGSFALLMLMVSVRFYKESQQKQLTPSEDFLRKVEISSETGKFIWTPLTALVLALIGMLTGLMTGLLGVGGGFLIVPLMKRLTHLTVPGIVATSLFVITLVGGGGVVSAIHGGAELPWFETSVFVSSMVGGMLMGRRLVHRLQAWQVQRGFALLLFFVSAYMLLKAFLSFE